MRDDDVPKVGHWLVTPGAREFAGLPGHFDELLEEMSTRGEGERGLLVARASELLAPGDLELPEWIDAETFHLIFVDAALPALMRLPTLLGLHKPDRRLHLTRDPAALRRLLVARARVVPTEGIVDAYVVDEELVLVLGDLTIRSFPRDRIPGIKRTKDDEFANFELDDDGSYLRWPALDLDLGVSSLLQAVDPGYQAEVEIERLAREDIGSALRELREEKRLRQRDVPGLSERHVRRLEKGTSRLTFEAAGHFAEAFDLALDRFLERLGRRVRQRSGAGDSAERTPDVIMEWP